MSEDGPTPRHLLVTNDFPPKVGGIQTYLWELWRRLPADSVTVLTTPYEGDDAFDHAQPFRVERTHQDLLLPTPKLANTINRLAEETNAELIVLDPAIPLGLVGPSLDKPYALVVHGSELIGRVPGGSRLMGRAVRRARAIIAAGNYPADEARRTAGQGKAPPITVVPPGVDTERFRPLEDDQERATARKRFDVADDALLVVGLSRLVRRKGFDVLIEAAARLKPRYPNLTVLVGGTGHEAERLQRIIDRTHAPARLIGRVDDDDLPALYGAADVFAMCCRTRWAGLEPEGFGIVFLEAAATATPQIAGDSGGAADAVEDGITGLVVKHPEDPAAVAHALDQLLADPSKRTTMGQQARRRAEDHFTYDVLARKLAHALTQATG
jgi:phosphatidylinositol alpha-1,6-mannosyltransferase